MLPRILLIIDDSGLRGELRRALTRPGVIVHSRRAADRLWERAARASSDLVVMAQSLVPEPAGETVRLLRELPESPEVVVLSEREDPAERAGLLAAGCEAVLSTGLPIDQLTNVLWAMLEKRRERADRRFAVGRDVARPRLTDFVSSSAAMQAFMSVVARVVHSNTSLLLLGETGVGKERLARAIHAEGPRAQGPFVTVNCGALPDALLESELFGHEEGAFTGATRTRRGSFELAHGGTLFLDEIGEVPHHLQVKLLRALQEHEIQPVGSEKPIKLDVRVVAATNRDLAAEVEAKQFRRDLFYRLSVVTLTIPPLRERREDIPELVESYIEHFGSQVPSDVSGIADDALDALLRYSWPGNVRELINVIERGVLLSSEDEITLDDLPESISGRQAASGSLVASLLHAHGADALPEECLDKPLSEARTEFLSAFERCYLAGLLRASGGRIGETAKRAGIQPRSLYDKMKRYGLRKEDFKPPRRP